MEWYGFLFGRDSDSHIDAVPPGQICLLGNSTMDPLTHRDDACVPEHNGSFGLALPEAWLRRLKHIMVPLKVLRWSHPNVPPRLIDHWPLVFLNKAL